MQSQSKQLNETQFHTILMLIFNSQVSWKRKKSFIALHGVDAISEETGATYLFFACANHRLDIVKFLISEGANVNHLSFDGETALCTAIDAAAVDPKGYEIAKFLLDQGANPNINFSQSSKFSSFSPLLFLAAHIQIGECWNEDAKALVNKLIEHGANVNFQNSKGLNVLALAVAAQNEAFIKLLLEHGANIRQIVKYKNGQIEGNILHLAVACAGIPLSILELLFKHGAKSLLHQPNARGYTPIHFACKYAKLDALQLFAKHGARFNAKTDDEEGNTPLLLACEDGHLEVVKFLLDHKADPHITSKLGRSCVTAAHDEGHVAVADYLLKNYLMKSQGPFSEKLYTVKTDESFPDGRRLTWFKCESLAGSDDQDHLFTCTQQVAPKVQSTHAFLSSQGLSGKEIKEWKEENKERKKQQRKEKEYKEPFEQEKEIEVKEPGIWFESAIHSEIPEVTAITGGATKSPNCYFYLDEESLTSQGCPIEQLKQFAALPKQFSPEENANGIKALKGKLYTHMLINGEKQKVELTDELKCANEPFRIFCFRKPADHGRATLIIGAVYAPNGAHKKNWVRKLKDRLFELHLPGRAEEQSQQQLTHKNN